MFLGTYSPRMDAKGRIILPAKFREELSAGLVLTRGQERCLYVFPAAEFERIHERMRTAPLPGRASFSVFMLSPAFLTLTHSFYTASGVSAQRTAFIMFAMS